MTPEFDVTPSGEITPHDAHTSDGAPDLLLDAADAIGNRAAQRDQADGERSMGRAIAAFNALYGSRLTEYHGWQFMALLKMSRAGTGPFDRDDFVDQGAYAALAGECALSGHLHRDVASSLRRARNA